MNTARRIEIKANNKQRTYFARAAGTAPVFIQLGSWRVEKGIRSWRKPTEAALRRRLNSIKKTEFPYFSSQTPEP
ncbi:MAG: hypothetical protein ACOVS5_04285, partial [Oligoflexus sp.]